MNMSHLKNSGFMSIMLNNFSYLFNSTIVNSEFLGRNK